MSTKKTTELTKSVQPKEFERLETGVVILSEQIKELFEALSTKNESDTTKAATARKQKSSAKKKASGFTSKTIHLSESALERMEDLAVALGHKIGDKGLSSEQLSMLVHFLLDNYKQPEDIETPKTAKGQYVYRLHQILKYRSTQMSDTMSEIVNFMKEKKYVIPKLYGSSSQVDKSQKYNWNKQLITSILDSDQLNPQIKKLNIKAKRNGRKVVRRKIPKTQHSSENQTKIEGMPTSTVITLQKVQSIFDQSSICLLGRRLTDDEILDKYGVEKIVLLRRIMNHYKSNSTIVLEQFMNELIAKNR
ncbi:hypothetical protein [Vibrio sp. CAU 1672]|uniref:hypothetical protein n=1 Tax=Vibrio sp. CAU 1672 TaxID=3032594 RepID=UPI0023DBA4ED|nr:hypothetical protein [Vibrio sp. CAU 1672]MDF2154142.1 hypothetical protein [Vibrio sp. CAU 1672]